MPRKYRPRKEFKFWLYHDRDEDSRLMDFIQYCKSTRQFARVVRDGIRLIWSLREGNTAVLFELFPHLERQFNPDAEDLIAQFRDMLLQHRTVPVPQPVQLDNGGGQGERKLLTVAKIDLPLLDNEEDGDTLVLTKKSGGITGSNLLSGILGLD
jgi:hypothetical protein